GRGECRAHAAAPAAARGNPRRRAMGGAGGGEDREGISKRRAQTRACQGGRNARQAAKRIGEINEMANPVLQFQILSKVPEETAPFYSELFAWKIDADNAMGYRRIDTGSTEGIQGGIWPAPPQAPVFVQLFVGVDDVRASVASA